MTRIYSATFQIPPTQADALGDYYIGRGALSSTSSQVDSDTTELTILATRKSWFKSVGISTDPTEVRPSDWKYTSHNDRPTVTLIPGVTIVAEGTSTNTLTGIQIILDPKDAFGDGHHPTTQL
ncbi:hypothetical protein EBR57_10515, partial [bacterium]|nr:hypothetical protein [bacterium]